jgi:hypothetical protein
LVLAPPLQVDHAPQLPMQSTAQVAESTKPAAISHCSPPFFAAVVISYVAVLVPKVQADHAS